MNLTTERTHTPSVDSAPSRPESPFVKTTTSAKKRNLLSFLMVMGPGIIVMEADNDAGAVSTYTQAGAQYGTHLLWVLLLLLPITYFVQEMVARLGIATGTGHAAMIYRRFGKAWGAFSLFDLQLANFLTLVTEFAAVELAMSKLGVPGWVSVPTAMIGLTALVTTGSYLKWERIVLTLCALDLAWFAMAIHGGPNWMSAARHAVVPTAPVGGWNRDVIFLLIAIVGTTIAPWQLYFQQSCVADKKLRFADLKFARLDTFVGAVFTIFVAGAMMLVGVASHDRGLKFEDPAQMAMNLGQSLGPWMRNGILIMMVNASILGATTISLSSAWAYGEVKGWPNSLHRKVREAPAFYAVYIGCVVLAGSIVLIPNAPLQLIILGVQVLAGLMLPSAIIFLQLLLNDRELLGDRFVNRPWNNVVNWTIIALLFGLSVVLAVQVLAPGLIGAK